MVILYLSSSDQHLDHFLVVGSVTAGVHKWKLGSRNRVEYTRLQISNSEIRVGVLYFLTIQMSFVSK